MTTTSIPPQLAARIVELGSITGPFTVDASLGNEFNATVDDDSTLTIINGCPGSIILNLLQGLGGTVDLGAEVIYSVSIPSFTASTTPGLVDSVGLRYSGTDDDYRILAVNQGATA